MSEKIDISVVPLRQVVADAADSLHVEFSSVERKYSRLAVRGLKELNKQIIKSGKRYAKLEVNQHTNTASLPCDLDSIIDIYYIDQHGEKVSLNMNKDIIPLDVETIPCQIECSEKCDCCYSKQLCNDLTVTEETETVILDGQEYNVEITKTLLPDGQYYVQKNTPYWDNEAEEVVWRETQEYITTFDTEKCGCIKTTESNAAKLKKHCYDAWCCYCACKASYCYRGGYMVFKETGTIQFDDSFTEKIVYIEWRGLLPKENGKYVVPGIASETIVAWIAFKEVEFNRSFTQTEKNWRLLRYTEAKDNMRKVRSQFTIGQMMTALFKTPRFG